VQKTPNKIYVYCKTTLSQRLDWKSKDIQIQFQYKTLKMMGV